MHNAPPAGSIVGSRTRRHDDFTKNRGHGPFPVEHLNIRLRFKEFTGKSDRHGHFLSHEDTRMMQNCTIH
jgi:hypothetical protein